MYTISALWTYAREGLDVTTVIFSNRCYAILAVELERVGAAGSAGEAARSLLDLCRPALDFTALAAGLGVPATRPPPRVSSPPGCGGPWPSRAPTSSRLYRPDRCTALTVVPP